VKGLLSLRVGVPLLFVVAAVLTSAIGVAVGVRASDLALRDDAATALAARLAQSQTALELLARHGDDAGVRELVAELGAERDVVGAVLFGPDDHVRAATRLALLGDARARALQTMGWDGTADDIAHAALGAGAPLVRDGQGHRLLGAVSFDTGAIGDRASVLVIEIDYDSALRATQGGIAPALVAYGAAATVLAFLLLLGFHRLVTQRTETLVRAADALAMGKLGTRAEVRGPDELGALGTRFDAMADRLEASHARLAQSEMRLRAIFDATADAVFAASPDGRYEAANPAAVDLLGYDEDELVGMKLEDIIAPDDLAARPIRVAEVRAERLLVSDRILRRRDDTRIPVHIAARRLADGRLLGVVHDRRAEIELDAMRHRLQSQDRLAALGTLAAGIGHEINNPLTYVIANVDLARDEVRSMGAGHESLAEALADAAEGAARVRQILDELRAFARGADRPTADARANVKHVVDAAARLVSPSLRSRAELVLDIADGVPDVAADEGRVVQVLVNLVVNAMQAFGDRPAGDCHVRVAARSEGTQVAIEVVDDGPGIPPDVLPRIFDRFFTTKKDAATEESVGTGLGLSISRDIVASYGGRIEVESDARGARFRVWLPAALGKADRKEPASVPAATPRHGGRLLIVDDEPAVLRALSRALGDFDVTTAASPREAREAIGKSEPDWVLCDVMMPGEGGVGLHRWLAGAHPHIASRFWFMTGGVVDGEARAYVDASGCALLTKPLDLADLRRRLGSTQPARG
jgi:PAS domain S-box-containing protein